MDRLSLSIVPKDVLLWLALLSILTALIGSFLLPQNGPMKLALNRTKLLLFVETVGLAFSLIYAAYVLGFLR